MVADKGQHHLIASEHSVNEGRLTLHKFDIVKSNELELLFWSGQKAWAMSL
jgi:hypothetical protein